MDENLHADSDKYYQIRQIASKNWLKPASVSLAKLDQVKTKVYNVGLTDANNLKSRGNILSSRGAIKVAEAGEDEEQEEALDREDDAVNVDPPLSRLTMQHRAWGSNSSIPEMIRKQNERQKSQLRKPRPESAKVTRPNRPPSGRKPRPQSAKDAAAPTREKIGILGSHYDPQERPDGLDIHAGSSGWVAPPGGCSNSDFVPESALSKTLSQVAESQIPVPPRTSPDFIQMLEAQDSMPAVDGDGVVGLVNGLFEQKPKPRTPSPIHLSLPQVRAEEDDDEDLELLGLKVDDDMSADNISALLEDITRLTNKQKVKKHSVHINESQNTTKDITPRKNRPPSGKQRPGGASRGDHLRNVKSRTDSGLQLYGKSKSAKETKNDPEESGVLVDESILLISKKAKPKLTTITVSYIEENEDKDEESKLKKKVRRKPTEVETLISRITQEEQADENEANNDLERPPSRVSTTPSNKNFYELAMQSGNERMKTVKTLQFGDESSSRQVVEHNVTSAIDAISRSRVEYVAPRPRSAVRKNCDKTQTDQESSLKEKRPASAVKSNRSETCTPVKPSNKTPLTNRATTSDITQRYENNHTSDQTIPGISTLECLTPASINNNIQSEEKNDPLQAINSDEKLDTPEEDKLATEERCPAADKTADSSLTANMSSVIACDCDTAVNYYGNTATETRGDANKRTCKCAHGLSAGRSRAQSAPATKTRTPSSPQRSRPYTGKGKKTKAKPPIEIWTRKDNYDADTEGLRECREMQEKLIEAGVPVTMETLTRALLPPAEGGYEGGDYKTELNPKLNKNFSSNLLSKPQFWLAEEYKRVQAAKKKVRVATQRLVEQQAEASYEKSERKKRHKKGKKKGVKANTPAAKLQ